MSSAALGGPEYSVQRLIATRASSNKYLALTLHGSGDLPGSAVKLPTGTSHSTSINNTKL